MRVGSIVAAITLQAACGEKAEEKPAPPSSDKVPEPAPSRKGDPPVPTAATTTTYWLSMISDRLEPPGGIMATLTFPATWKEERLDTRRAPKLIPVGNEGVVNGLTLNVWPCPEDATEAACGDTITATFSGGDGPPRESTTLPDGRRWTIGKVGKMDDLRLLTYNAATKHFVVCEVLLSAQAAARQAEAKAICESLKLEDGSTCERVSKHMIHIGMIEDKKRLDGHGDEKQRAQALRRKPNRTERIQQVFDHCKRENWSVECRRCVLKTESVRGFGACPCGR